MWKWYECRYCCKSLKIAELTIFPPEDKTGRDRRLIWLRLITEATGEFIAVR